MSAPHEDDMAPQPPDGDAGRSAHYVGRHWDSESSDDDLDEIGAVLRERFQQAVSTLEPLPGTLDYLRRAVPARRRRRNTALAATAVSVFAVSAGATLAARGSFDSGSSQTNGTTIGNLMTTATNDAPGGGSGHGPATPGGQDMSSGGGVGAEAPSSLASASGNSKPSSTTPSPASTATGSPLTALCQNSSLSSVVATQSGATGGTVYETFVGTAKAACTLQGMPGLTVLGAGGQPAKIPVYKADQTAAPLLPTVPTGQQLVLQAGDRFEFQLAWVPTACPTIPPPTTPPSSVPPSSGSPTTTASSSGPTPSGPTTSASSQPTPSGSASSSAPVSSAYSVAYSVYGSQTAQSVSFRADCGASVYVTAYFQAPGQKRTSQPTTGR
ncbi:hypothetical protein ABH935_003289 [Catenulispora sp. GAS73]|uniref:hypothetical protein n=1 Tax=Catenulispora sp. GAS73 TaxID=3156269 RepID=UPI003519B91D